MSRVIKSSFANNTLDEKRVIGIQKLKLSQYGLEDDQKNEGYISEMKLESETMIHEAKRQAEQILISAQSQLEETLAEINDQKKQWELEKQHIHLLAREEGYALGIEEGKKEGFDQYKALIADAREIINVSKKEYLSLIDSSDETILKIGIKVAEKIINKQLSESNEDFLLLVKKAIKEVSEHTQIQIHVHPRYFELLLNQKEELRNLFNKETDISIFPNEDLAETSCMIESSFGRVDASVDSQLVEIKNKLLSLLVGE